MSAITPSPMTVTSATRNGPSTIAAASRVSGARARSAARTSGGSRTRQRSADVGVQLYQVHVRARETLRDLGHDPRPLTAARDAESQEPYRPQQGEGPVASPRTRRPDRRHDAGVLERAHAQDDVVRAGRLDRQRVQHAGAELRELLRFLVGEGRDRAGPRYVTGVGGEHGYVPLDELDPFGVQEGAEPRGGVVRPTAAERRHFAFEATTEVPGDDRDLPPGEDPPDSPPDGGPGPVEEDARGAVGVVGDQSEPVGLHADCRESLPSEELRQPVDRDPLALAQDPVHERSGERPPGLCLGEQASEAGKVTSPGRGKARVEHAELVDDLPVERGGTRPSGPERESVRHPLTGGGHDDQGATLRERGAYIRDDPAGVPEGRATELEHDRTSAGHDAHGLPVGSAPRARA